MIPSFKFLSSYFSYRLHSFVGGTHIKQKSINKSLLANVTIKNKKLARELEIACKKKGVLSFAEFLDISQFGTNGYYATHTYHGMTDTYLRWPEAINALCKKENYNHIVEFGCGDGKLGLETMKIAKRKALKLSWTGIDINPQELEKAQEAFQKEGFLSPLSKHSESKGLRQAQAKINFYTSLESVKIKNPCLLVFSYSLDSVLPELLINTTDKQGSPNTMIGVKIDHGTLSEVLLPVMPEQSDSIPSRFYRPAASRMTFNFPFSIKLHPWQRMCVPIVAEKILADCVKKLPKGSSILILDEFTPKPLPWETQDLCLPRDLERFDPNREIKDFKTFYETSGENLLYFPHFLSTYIDILKKGGLTDICFDSEHIGSQKIMRGKEFTNPEDKIRCYAVQGIRT